MAENPRQDPSEEFRRRLQEEEAKAGENEMRFREQDPYWGLNRNFTRIVRSLRDLNNPTTPEVRRKEIREELPIYHERFMIHLLADGGKELDNGFLQWENLYPFKTGQGDSVLEGTLSAVDTTLLEEEWGRTPEAQFWLLKTAQDTLWVTHNRKLLIGMSGMVNKMYDWEKIMMQVMETYRKDPMTLSYELTFEKKFRADALPGKIGVRDLNGRERFSLREEGIRYHADNAFWSRAAAGVGQAEYVDGQRRSMGALDENGRWVEGLTDREFKFAQLMFGTDKDGNWSGYKEDGWASYDGKKFPHRVLSWQSMGSSQVNKEIYVAIMSELLTRNVRHELEKPEYRDDSGLKALVEEIKKSVELRRSKLFNPFVPSDKFGQEKYLNLLLADHVVKSGIVFDWGHKVAVHKGWQWKYDGKGGREWAGGGPTTATDSATGPMWRAFQNESAEKNWPYGLLPGSSPEYRKMLASKRPDYRPTLRDMSPSAAVTDDERSAGEPKRMAYEKLRERIMQVNPDAWNLYFKDQVWYWETPYKTRDKKNLVLPMWIPPIFESVDFFHTIPWNPREQVKQEIKEVGGKKVLRGGLTLHEALQMGYDLSEKEWSEVEGAKTTDSAYYRHLISMGQLLKALHVMTAKPELATQEINSLFGVSAMFDEFQKRGDLGPRDERTPFSIINASLVPLLIMEYTGKIKRGIFTVEGGSSKTLGQWVAGDLEEWRRVIERDAPNTKDGINGYKHIMLALFDFYYTQYIFAANQTGIALIGQEKRTENYLIKIAEQQAGVKVDLISPVLEQEATIR